MCYPIETWLKYLRTHGLLSVVATTALPPWPGTHSRVVEGLSGYRAASASGDLFDTSTTFMQIMDPQWGGVRYLENFELFNNKYEALSVFSKYDETLFGVPASLSWYFTLAHY